MAQSTQGQPQINIELPADLEATYSNFAIISHSPSEIVIDFARLLPGVPKSKVLSRIVMTPLNLSLWGGLNPETAKILKVVALDPLDMLLAVLVMSMSTPRKTAASLFHVADRASPVEASERDPCVKLSAVPGCHRLFAALHARGCLSVALRCWRL